ncbi:MAG: hypothetical protein JXR69_07040 [Candidatus Delongbacteria bacterium]|nr:hypothetical protein [Candidatus Delongbacteria bacterium]
MKKILIVLLTMMLCLAFAQDEETSAPPTSNTDDTGVSGTAIIGGISIDGKNYQQIGFRFDVPIGKFGFGLDAQLLIDEEGNIRSEDWDEVEDYMDKIYYVRWAKKGDPFYIRLGGLDYTYLGYNIVVDGYSNMIEYPAYKRLGMELSFEGEKFGGEVLVNNYKELFTEKPGMLFGARAFYKVWGDLAIGATYATDLNQLNGLRDNDDDDYPNEIDMYPEDDRYVTDWDYYSINMNADLADSLVYYNIIDSLKKSDLPSYADSSKSVAIWGFDIGYPIFKNDFMNIDVYGQFAQIQDYGWGYSAPAFRVKAGPFMFSAEYRHTDGEFLFGFFNPTYEMERATYNGSTFITKSQTLKDTPALDGFFVGLHFNAWDWFTLKADYQDLKGEYPITKDDYEVKSLRGEFAINENLIPKISLAKAYYMQNNVVDLSEWRTPSTIMGYSIGYNINEGTSIIFDYRYTFEDMNGDLDVEDDGETIKTISISTAIKF